jgi:hypothetical protein
MSAASREDVPENANEGCVGVTSETAGKVRLVPCVPVQCWPGSQATLSAAVRASCPPLAGPLSRRGCIAGCGLPGMPEPIALRVRRGKEGGPR